MVPHGDLARVGAGRDLVPVEDHVVRERRVVLELDFLASSDGELARLEH